MQYRRNALDVPIGVVEVNLEEELREHQGEFKEVEMKLNLKNEQNDRIGSLRVTLNGIQQNYNMTRSPPTHETNQSDTRNQTPVQSESGLNRSASNQSSHSSIHNSSSNSPPLISAGRIAPPTIPPPPRPSREEPKSATIIAKSVADMTEREVSFLLKRRGLAAPGDHEQAREMAQEQRNQDMERARAMSVRELKETLSGPEL